MTWLLKLIAQFSARVKLTGVLVILLVASITFNVLQHSARKTAAAECFAAAQTIAAELATARAEAERLRAEQIGTLSLLIAQDDADTRAELERAQALTRSAAAAYAAAQRAHPTTCRASADHVRAVNAARGSATE